MITPSDYTVEPGEFPFPLGKCCACGRGGSSVKTMLSVHRLAPKKGTGWGCKICGLPTDGAIAVVCDVCYALSKEIKLICVGYPAENKRIPIESISEVKFKCNLDLHKDQLAE